MTKKINIFSFSKKSGLFFSLLYFSFMFITLFTDLKFSYLNLLPSDKWFQVIILIIATPFLGNMVLLAFYPVLKIAKNEILFTDTSVFNFLKTYKLNWNNVTKVETPSISRAGYTDIFLNCGPKEKRVSVFFDSPEYFEVLHLVKKNVSHNHIDDLSLKITIDKKIQKKIMKYNKEFRTYILGILILVPCVILLHYLPKWMP